MHSKVPLQGAELEAYLQQEKEKKEKEAAQQAALARNQRMLEADEDESDSDSDSDAEEEEEDEVRRALEGGMDVDDDDNRVSRRRKGDNVDSADWALDGDEGLTKQFLSFDIYLKGNVSKATSFFKAAGVQTQRFRMFPYVEKKRRVDEYGETIDVGMWLRKGKALEEEAESDEIKDYKRKLQEEEEAKVSAISAQASDCLYLVTENQRTTVKVRDHKHRRSVSMSPFVRRYGRPQRRKSG